MQKIGLHDKPMKWFPGVNSLMTSGNNTEGSSFAQNTYVTKYNYVIIKKGLLQWVVFVIHSPCQLEYSLISAISLLKTQELNQLYYILHSVLSNNTFTYCCRNIYKYLSLLWSKEQEVIAFRPMLKLNEVQIWTVLTTLHHKVKVNFSTR